jgi:hypothetical protein
MSAIHFLKNRADGSLSQTRAACRGQSAILAKTMNIGLNEARQALTGMQFEGYVASAGGSGNGGRCYRGNRSPARNRRAFTRESVDKAFI